MILDRCNACRNLLSVDSEQIPASNQKWFLVQPQQLRLELIGELDRATAQCNFRDTDFVGTDGPGGGKFGDSSTLADHVETLWGDERERRLVVITGGGTGQRSDQTHHDHHYQYGAAQQELTALRDRLKSSLAGIPSNASGNESPDAAAEPPHSTAELADRIKSGGVSQPAAPIESLLKKIKKPMGSA